jgi:hypothetical protein
MTRLLQCELHKGSVAREHCGFNLMHGTQSLAHKKSRINYATNLPRQTEIFRYFTYLRASESERNLAAA